MRKHAIVCLVLVLAACGGASPNGDGDVRTLEGRRFVVSELVVEGGSIDVTAGPPTMNFEDGRISGNTGCNDYGGLAILAPDGELRVTEIAATEMFCEATADIESGFTTALLAVDRWALETDTLTLTDTETDTEIVLVDAGPAPIN